MLNSQFYIGDMQPPPNFKIISQESLSISGILPDSCSFELCLFGLTKLIKIFKNFNIIIDIT